jgi:hypothetical protein
MRAAAARGRERAAGGRFFSFLAWLFPLFGGSENVLERARKRSLKRLARNIAANPYGRFFRAKGGMATPDLAQFFYGIYGTVAPARRLLRNVIPSTRLKTRVATSFLEPAQRELAERLSAACIAPGEEAAEAEARQLQEEFAELERAFDTGRRNVINECYRLVLIICQFVAHDHGALLKKFDPRLSEFCPGKNPEFAAAPCGAVTEDLKDFLELAVDLDPGFDWSAPLRALRDFLGMEAISPGAWKSMLQQIRAVAGSEIFELLIRYAERDPGWAWTPHATAQEDIVASYLDLTKGEIAARLALAAATKRNAVMERHAVAVFGTARVGNRLKYYTEQEGELYRKQGFAGFTEARTLNFLYAFLSDALLDLQNLCELIIIQGHWVSTALSFPLGEALRLLGEVPSRIADLDELFSEWGVYGARLKAALTVAARDKSRGQVFARRLAAANGMARQIAADALAALSALDGNLQELLEDCRKERGVIILNWDRLNSFSKTKLESLIAAMRNRLAAMQELLRAMAQYLD